MEIQILVGLIYNTALLLSMCLVYDALVLNRNAAQSFLKKVLTGSLLGAIGIAVMSTHWQWYPGIIFDTRSLLLSISGLFFGSVPTVIAMGMTGAYRFYLGGSGAMMGISVIMASGIIGILWRKKSRTEPADTSFLALYVFGAVVSLAMLFLMLLLPGPVILETMIKIGVPVMIIYPVGTALLGSLIASRHRHIRAEESLRESEERFTYAMEATRDGLWDWDITSNTGYFSPGYFRMLGYQPSDFATTSHSWVDLLHPEDRDHAVSVNSACIEKEIDCFELEFRMRAKSGDWVWILGRGKAVSRDKDGRAVRMVGTHVDITERKIAEEKVRESERRYRTLFELESDATFLIDNENGDILEVNETASKLYGYTREELTGLRNVDLSAEPEQTRQAGRDKLTAIPVRWHRKKDGMAFPVEIAARHITWQDRSVHIASIRDISERIRYEEERKALETQLFQSQKIEAVGQLAGGIAHDFNNILTVILGYAAIMLKKIEERDPLRPLLEQIVSSATRAADLTKGLLAFSRKQILDSRPVGMDEVVLDIRKMLGRIIREDIDFRTIVPDVILTVHADKGQMGQVLINLVTNAVDAMPDGGELTIRVQPYTMDAHFMEKHGFGKPGEYACVSVEDSGIGMDEKTREKIFEPFFTTKAPGKGTGLGLSIVYGIVRQHNGFITVEAGKEIGTAFRVYLPLVGPQVCETVSEEPRDYALVCGRETILLAEDDEIVREMNEIALSEAGYRVITARDGEDARIKFMENRDAIDLLVFDVVMPKKDGKTAYEEIKRLHPGTKALFMSGYTRDIIVRKGIPDDDFFFISKPFKPYELLQKAREILDR
jgi:PAS domain S-box-containing protein